MQTMFLRSVALLALWGLSMSVATRAQETPQSDVGTSGSALKKKLPTAVILVKGAWSSSSDSVTPLPEGGKVGTDVYSNPYFGLTYALPPDWTEKYSGPPPSDSGYYVLAQLRPADTFKGTSHGTILIAAQDLFFTPTSAKTALELANYTRDKLNAEYTVEKPPTEARIGNHSFARFDYSSPVADLHWRVLTTQIRCHFVQFIITSRDTKLEETLIQGMGEMKFATDASPTQGTESEVPICIPGYASGENVKERVDPVFPERRFNPVPVRIIIDKDGKIKHIHFISAFPDQAEAISEALSHWRFKPYLRDGHPVEVETGVMFGPAPRPVIPPSTGAATE
jgi:hypothetical protein